MLTQRQITRFWAPLAGTWLMMAAEGPFLAAIIARLDEPTNNLAAFGVALSFAMFNEAPIIMVLSAATALVRDHRSFLALTSIITLGVQPIVTFFLGHARSPVQSLAVLPVVNALVFIFRSPGLAFQEVGIALVGEERQGRRSLARFALSLGLAASFALAAVAWTPLAGVWLEGVSGLSHALAGVALVPIRILALMPALEVLLSFQRAMLVSVRATRLITLATAIEMGGIVALLAVGTGPLALVGIVAAAAAALGGRLAANLFLALRRAP